MVEGADKNGAIKAIFPKVWRHLPDRLKKPYATAFTTVILVALGVTLIYVPIALVQQCRGPKVPELPPQVSQTGTRSAPVKTPEPGASSTPLAGVNDSPPNFGPGAPMYHINAANFGDGGPMVLGSNAPNAAPVYVVESAVNAPHGVIQNGQIRNYNSYIQGDPVIQNGNVENVGGAIKSGAAPSLTRDGGTR